MSAYIDFLSMLGYNNTALMSMTAFEGSSNVILTDNPAYELTTFQAHFPTFVIGEETGKIPLAIFNLFKAMADKTIKKDRYFTSWEYFMGLYIAHYLTLYLQTQSGTPGSQQALQAAMPKGVATSKSVGDLSVSYDFMDMANDLAGYGTYKLTAYGQLLATLTKAYGAAGMWVNG